MDTSKGTLRPPQADTKRGELDVQIAILERRILDLQAQLHRLRVRRNDTAMISALPDEVLCDIWNICRMNAQDRNQWTVITWVCNRWRTSAIGHALLWSDIRENDSIRWIAAKLERSKTHSLTIHRDFWSTLRTRQLPEEVATAFCNTLSQTWRLKSVVLGNISPNVLNRQIKSFSPYAPLLTTLSLSHSFQRLVQSSSRIHLPIPPTFLHQGAPLLRNLMIHNCTPAWTSPIFNNLTHLHLVLEPVDVVEPCFTAGEFLDMLTRMPNIATLIVDATFPSFSMVSHPIVSLPHLRSLTLIDNFGDIPPYVMKYTQADALEMVAFECRTITNSSIEAFSLFALSWLGHYQHTADSNVASFKTCYFATGSYNAASNEQPSIHLWVDDITPMPYYEYLNARGTISLTVSGQPIDDLLTNSILHCVPFHDVRSLVFLGTYCSPPGAFDWNLHFPLLERVVLHEAVAAATFVEYITADVPSSSDITTGAAGQGGSPAVVLPHLKSIWFQDMLFGTDPEEYEVNPTRLVDVLIQRAQSGRKLDRFQVDRSAFPPLEWERLQQGMGGLVLNGDPV